MALDDIRIASSDFIIEPELPPLMKAAQREGLAIVWIPVSASSHAETELADYQAAHDPLRFHVIARRECRAS